MTCGVSLLGLEVPQKCQSIILLYMFKKEKKKGFKEDSDGCTSGRCVLFALFKESGESIVGSP